MPVAARSAPPASKTNANKPIVKKKRVVRRRGRAPHATDSDDEIEREVGTDSDSDVDSVISSASETETEPPTELIRPGVFTPNTSHSSAATSNGHPSSVFAPTTNWSEMVAEEAAGGAADLPVIDFAELNDRPPSAKPAPPARKLKKVAQKTRAATSLPSPPLSVTEEHEDEPTEAQLEEPQPAPPHDSARRAHGQNARQAYQNRLEADPSYVPTVGEFWGHDDRLLDKDLRSLSGWWRGRWQGRGRGRGSFGMRGRGGFMGGPPPVEDTSLPPVERTWNHDGFEELKRTEEARRDQQQTTRGGWGLRGGRGTGFVRGRGGFTRGGFIASPARSVSTLPSGRIWYPVKPELAWTKQQEGFLYTDFGMRPRRGRGFGYRIKLPGDRGQVIRSPLPNVRHLPVANPAPASVGSIGGSEYGDQPVVVRLPSKDAVRQAAARPPTKQKQSTSPKAQELSIEEIFTVRPQLVAAKPIPLPQPSISPEAPQLTPSAFVQQKLEQLSISPEIDETRRSKTEEAVLRNPSDHSQPEPSSSTSEPRPSLAPLQTAFTPPPQPSPYMSNYPYGVPLPPGIGVDPLGMTFEVATGRPVYIQAPPVYNPRMMAPPFVPGHMHHHSSLSEFVPSPPPPPMSTFIDPSVGMPLFSYPQPARVEIRAPGGDSVRPTHARTPSTLRSSAVAFTPTKATGGEQQEGQSDAIYPVPEGDEGQPADQQGMMYAPYGQYYYPDAYGGYNMPYMDMSQMPQYDMYSQEPIPQGTVYYQ